MNRDGRRNRILIEPFPYGVGKPALVRPDRAAAGCRALTSDLLVRPRPAQHHNDREQDHADLAVHFPSARRPEFHRGRTRDRSSNPSGSLRIRLLPIDLERIYPETRKSRKCRLTPRSPIRNALTALRALNSPREDLRVQDRLRFFRSGASLTYDFSVAVSGWKSLPISSSKGTSSGNIQTSLG